MSHDAEIGDYAAEIEEFFAWHEKELLVRLKDDLTRIAADAYYRFVRPFERETGTEMKAAIGGARLRMDDGELATNYTSADLEHGTVGLTELEALAHQTEARVWRAQIGDEALDIENAFERMVCTPTFGQYLRVFLLQEEERAKKEQARPPAASVGPDPRDRHWLLYEDGGDPVGCTSAQSAGEAVRQAVPRKDWDEFSAVRIEEVDCPICEEVG